MKKVTVLSLVSVAMLAGSVCLRAADAPEHWTKLCASCHGKDGKGQTKAGRMSQAKDFTDAAYQASFTDEQAHKQVKEGLKDKNGKDRMKPFADKLSDAEISALIAYVRTLKQ